MRQLNCTIANPDGTAVPAGTPVYTELIVDDPALDGGVRYGGRVEEDGRFIVHFPDCAPQGQGANLTVAIKDAAWRGRIVTPSQPSCEMGTEGGDTAIALVETASTPFRRTGIVRSSGRAILDDDGPFNPLGATLFWAVRGWKYERDRVRSNLAWLASHGFDYYRILAAVDWGDNSTDPTWPDHREQLADLLNAAYDDYGLRCEVTMTGGGDWDLNALTDTVVDVANARPEAILHLEVSNESYNNGPDQDTLKRLGQRLLNETPCLVALSAPANSSPGTAAGVSAGVASMLTIHFDRTWSDGGWRSVRQAWDWGESTAWVGSHNEPTGPASSVAEEWNPLHLAMTRAISIMCGGACYVLHNAAGVSGQPDPNRGRTPNLYEMPGIDPIMDAVRGVDALVPPAVVTWTRVNDGWVPPNPTLPYGVTSWADSGTGPIKHYGAIAGASFVSMPHGIRHAITLKATRDCRFTAYDPLTHEAVAVLTLAAGQTATLAGAPGSPDDETATNCAYILVGHQ